MLKSFATRFCLLLAVAVLAAYLDHAFRIPEAFAKDIRVTGGAAPINNIFRRIQKSFESAGADKLVLSEEGPDVALIQLDSGQTDLATAGLSREEWVQLAENKAGKALAHKSEFKYRTIGRDLIQVYAHRDVTVGKLSSAQLKGIFTGATHNWKEVGGPDLPIVVVLGSKIPGTNKVFQKQVLEGGSYTAGAKQTGTAPEIGRLISSTPGAVGIGPVGLDTQGMILKKVEIPVVGRPIVAATRGVPTAETGRLFQFIQKESSLTKEN